MRLQLLGYLSRQLAAESDLSEAEYLVLVTLSEAPDRSLRSKDLGSQLQWEQSRVSHQLARMDRRGLLTRQPCATDARGCVAVLTESGRLVIRKAARLHSADIRHCFADVLTPHQLDSLAEIAEAITGHLAAEHGVTVPEVPER
jgi:DNA-binding MarR family transcriptional regulator